MGEGGKVNSLRGTAREDFKGQNKDTGGSKREKDTVEHEYQPSVGAPQKTQEHRRSRYHDLLDS